MAVPRPVCRNTFDTRESKVTIYRRFSSNPTLSRYDLRCLSYNSSQCSSSTRAGLIAIFQREDSVDPYYIDSGTVVVRVRELRAVFVVGKIEQKEIREKPFCDSTAVFEFKSLTRKRGHLLDCFF